MSSKILLVDDEPLVLAAYRRILIRRFAIETVLGPEEGLAAIASRGPFAVVVADMQMPEMDGVQFLARVETLSPESVRLMITGNSDIKTAIEAVNRGDVFRFLTKPCPAETLVPALEGALKQHRLLTAERELLENTLNGTVKMLTDILALSDPTGFGRARRLRESMRRFAKHFGLARTWDLELAAMLSSMGRVALPSSLIRRSADGLTLTNPEQDMLAAVPSTGAALLADIPRLESAAHIVRYQNKNYDGAGPPDDDVAGDEIPIGARILRVINDLQMIESRGVPRSDAVAKLRSARGCYDAEVLEAVAAGVDLCQERTSETDIDPRILSLAELRVGDRLGHDVKTLDGCVIAPSGTDVTDLVLQKVRNYAKLSGIEEPLHVSR
jgi:response regulator RpfG family c-di-GMP phosphodiesterase